MIVRIAQVDTELAPSALATRLTESGATITASTEDCLCRIECPDGNAAALAEALATFVFTDWLYEYLQRRIGILHTYLTEDEQQYVALLTFHGLRKSEETLAGRTWPEWVDYMTQAFAEILSETEVSLLSIDGVMRFRARQLLESLTTPIQEMVDQFLMDREYEEFVSMLRYMLEAQPTSGTMNVYCTDDRIWICDGAGNLIRDRAVTEAAEQVSDGGEVNSEDLAMSILITRSPAEIVIHDLTKAAPWPSFPETLERVFLERAHRCGHCATCAHLEQPLPPLHANGHDAGHE